MANHEESATPYFRVLIAVLRVALYLIPPACQIIVLVFIENKYLSVTLIIMGSLTTLLSIPGAAMSVYTLRKNCLGFYGIHEVQGLYNGSSLITYLLTPFIITLVAAIFTNKNFHVYMIPNLLFIPVTLLSGLTTYIIFEPNCAAIMRRMRKTLAVIHFILFLVAFPVIQITFSAIYPYGSEPIIYTIWIYTILQIFIGGYGVARLAYDTIMVEDFCRCRCCCRDMHIYPTKFRTLVSGGYILYMLMLWIPVQLIVAWVNYEFLSKAGKLIIYLPFLVFALTVTVGYSLAVKAKNKELDRLIIKDVDKKEEVVES